MIMENKIVRYGVVGLGRGSSVAISCCHPQSKLVAACDHNPAILEKGRENFENAGMKDVEYFSDYDEMLEKADIDAVIVATEAIYHVPIVKKAMDAGKHVLSEIPSVNSVEEAYELKAIVSSHPDLIYMAAENCCYWAFIETWKQMHDAGEFGEIVYAEAEYLHAKDPNEFSPDNYSKGHWRTFNPAIKYLTHELGPLLYIMDDRCVSVTCLEPDIVYNPYFPQKNGVGAALLKTAKGAVIRILVSFGAYTSYDHNYRLCGTRGTIMNDPLKMVNNAHSFANLHSVPGSFTKKFEIPVTTAYKDENGNPLEVGHGGADPVMGRDFIECVLAGKKPKLDVDFAIRMSLPGVLAHESAVRGGEPIEIPDI